MKLFIGLGNPGDKYKKNRHNAGHLFVDWAKKEDFFSKEVFFTKTDCFMNESGRFVSYKVNFFKVNTNDLFIVHDDLDIPLGQFKIQFGVGPKVHNGLLSIEQVLGTKPFDSAQGKDFWRVRIGTDNRQISNRKSEIANRKLGETGKEYVLDDFSNEEIKVLEELFPKILNELKKKFDFSNCSSLA